MAPNAGGITDTMAMSPVKKKNRPHHVFCFHGVSLSCLSPSAALCRLWWCCPSSVGKSPSVYGGLYAVGGVPTHDDDDAGSWCWWRRDQLMSVGATRKRDLQQGCRRLYALHTDFSLLCPLKRFPYNFTWHMNNRHWW